MSYAAPTTTTNTAEYWGLIHSLRHAAARNYQPLHDSAMIIYQHQMPKKPKLKTAYRQSSRLTLHHNREHSKWPIWRPTKRWTRAPPNSTIQRLGGPLRRLSDGSSTMTSHSGSTPASINGIGPREMPSQHSLHAASLAIKQGRQHQETTAGEAPTGA